MASDGLSEGRLSRSITIEILACKRFNFWKRFFEMLFDFLEEHFSMKMLSRYQSSSIH